MKKSVAIFQYDLGFGGIQRSLINLLNNIDLTKYEIDLFLVDQKIVIGSPPESINIYPLNTLPFWTKLVPFGLISLLFGRRYQIDKHYDIAIDFNGYQAVTALATINSNSSKKAIWVHSNYSLRAKHDIKFRISYFLQKSKNRLFDAHVFVSEGLSSSWRSNIKNRYTIPNYIDTSGIIKKAKEQVHYRVPSNTYNLVSVSRLVGVKNIPNVVKLVHRLVEAEKPIGLYIIGNGPEYSNIARTIEQLGAESHIQMLGAMKNPYAVMQQMDGLIMMSEYEGQGISALEAKCLGLDIFIPKHLEEYTYGIKGSQDLFKDILKSEKRYHKNFDNLSEYNNDILKKFDKLVG